MKCNLYLFLNVLIFIAGFYCLTTRAQNYTRPQIVSRNCTSFTLSSRVCSSTVLPWGFDWRISDGKTTLVLVSVTVPADATKYLIITPGPQSVYSNRYRISNTPNPINSTNTPFNSTVTIELLNVERLSLSVPGLTSDPFSRLVCALNDVGYYYASSISCETDPCTYESKANLICSIGGMVETTCGCDEHFVDSCCCCFQTSRGQNYTRPKLDSRSCTSITVSSLVFPSTALPWGFDWRINDGSERVVLVSVTVSSASAALLIVPGPSSKFSNRYRIRNSPDPIGSTRTPFTSTVTVTDLRGGEQVFLSVPGLNSDTFTSNECSLVNTNFYGASNISCDTIPCTHDSEARLVCSNGEVIKAVCTCDGRFNRTCDTNEQLSVGDKVGISIGVICGVGVISVGLFFIIKKIKS